MKKTLFNPDARYCPQCKADWRGAPIPEKSRHLYGSNDGYFHRIIGVELAYDHPDHYDGVSQWECPDCSAKWNRFTGKLIK